ncbi:MAG TPA: PAS domain-containing protein, partial [Methylomirabilota bacterium]|nr:PAS domain-containing protein [Methylomirabilota bacterium]
EITLTALNANPRILAAVVYDKAGKPMAMYQRADLRTRFLAPPVRDTGTHFEKDRLNAFRRIVLADETIGTIYIGSDLNELTARFWRYGMIVSLVLLLSSLAAYALSAKLQHVISGPISHLAAIANTVATEKDYSVRATKQGDDELGQLINAFNGMLNEIQSRDSALRDARNKLEERVEERTQSLQLEIRERSVAQAALRDSDDKFRLLAENITDVFWIRSPDMREVHYVSPGFERIWGRSTESLHTNPEQWTDAIWPEDRERVLAAFATLTGAAPSISIEYRITGTNGEMKWVHVRGFQVRDAAGELVRLTGIVTDITERKQADERLDAAHKQLLDTSRQAGMAEVATSVLHNVGNVLNSVNVSTTLVAEQIKKSKVANLAKAVALMTKHAADLGEFMTNDPKGKQLPGYFIQLASHLQAEQATLLNEMGELRKNIEHIKDIVAMQQSYARVSGVTEMLKITDLVEDALRMNAAALTRHEVEVVREFAEVPPVTIDKHKVLQVLVNLIRNAKYACDESGRADKRMTVRVANDEGRLKIAIIDNGVGIPAENLIRIFNHGFTTRKEGHGFGLHSGALAAKEMGGALVVHSEGPGCGASFTLELPARSDEQPSQRG